MALNHLGEPFKGTIWYWLEDTYGSGESATTLPISCKVQSVRVDSGDRFKVLKDIGSPLACNFLEQTKEPKLHLEYIPQADDTMIDDVIDRMGSCCSLQSLAFCVGANTCMADADNKSYFYVTGAKPATVRIAASKNTEYMVTVDYEVKSAVTSKVATGSAPSVLTGEYLAFNIAGEIRKTGGHIVDGDHIAFICNSIDITVTHKLEGHTDHDSLEKDYLIESDMDIEGSVDITLDGGGASHFGEVMANTAFTIEIDMGEEGAPKITLPGCQWKNTSVTIDVSGEGMKNSTPFSAKPTDCTAIVTAVD